jgi:hypothetical protein
MNNKEDIQTQDCEKKMKKCRNMGRGGSSGGAFYCLGLIGAAVYFIQHAHSFTDGLMGVLKAVIWPALVAYKFFELFKF